MSNWTPEWKLTLDGGLDYTNLTLANLTITAGRTTIYQQPQASYASFQILNFNQDTVNISMNDAVTISVKNSSGVYVPIFGGTVTDLSQMVRSANQNTIVQTLDIIAVGSLAKLQKATTTGVLSKDFDGNQIYTILSQTLFNSWNKVPATTTWAGYTATTTWTNAENSGLGEIDRPGDYELTARTSSVTDIYSLASELANSGLGYLYEDSEGRIGYADSTHRSQYLTTHPFIDLSANAAYSSGIKTSTRSGDIRNKVTITYKNNATYTASDTTSTGLYGEQASNFYTSLENSADATTQANFYLGLRAYPHANFDSITFPIANPELTDTQRNALLSVFMGMPVAITDLPTNMQTGSFEGFIEGWTFRASYNGLSLSLNLSPAAYSVQSFRWNSVANTETWNTLNPTLEWLNATIVS